ncbi:MAG: aspartate racemase [Kiritimatiellia bacterium]
MKTIGLLGGMTWHSSGRYYQLINEGVAERLGPFRSAKIVLHSVDYGELRRSRADGDWRRLGRQLGAAARGLQKAGADGIFVCSNTIHNLLPAIQARCSLPVLHICDAVADALEEQMIDEVGLLGTAFTVRQPFYIDRLRDRGLRVHVNDPETVDSLHHIIMHELARGQVTTDSRLRFAEAIEGLQESGARAIILGCTEIGMIVDPKNVDIPVIDSTVAHANAAISWALDEGETRRATKQ